jgi:hypothetical protein
VNDLVIAARFHWKYDWVAELPHDVYEILVEELRKDDGDHRPV